MKTASLFATVVCVWLCASAALAETCTVTGTYRSEPVDLYYCDTNHMNCSGWLQTNLDQMRDTSAAPVRYIRVLVRSTSGTTLATTHTNASGTFTTTFESTALPNAPAVCRGQSVILRTEFVRLDERDLLAATKRYRFRIVNRNDVLQSHARRDTFPPTGATLTSPYTQRIRRDANDVIVEDALNHYYSAYHIMDAAVGEAINWSTNLRDRLTSSVITEQQPVVMDINWNSAPTTDSSSTQRGKIWMPWTGYRAGGVLRHEFGHWVHQLVHNRQQARGTCVDGRYPSYQAPPPPVGAVNHGVGSCEYGYTATLEGMATFFGVRSVTSADTSVWMCYYASGPDDACARAVQSRDSDADRDGVHANWQILGDLHADRPSRCAVPESTSCGCGADCATQGQKNLRGYRVETQVARFMWDLIDAGADSGGVDTVDHSMNSLVTPLQRMSCDSSRLGLDNTCNEATLSGSCNLDAYNVYDISAQLPTDETQVRRLNCVAEARDCTVENPCPRP